MTKPIIAICDYGMGNLHSVSSALEHVSPGHEVIISADAELIARAERVIFPGVGAVRDCMAGIIDNGFDRIIREQVAAGKPVLGICVGMQVLLSSSDENNGVPCLDFFPGRVRFFGNDLVDERGTPLKVPHMGWNNVSQVRAHPLWAGIEDGARFYFVHSYCAQLQNPEFELGHCEYGIGFTAAVCKDNLVAVQFHPEKSHDAGLQLLRNFCQWQG